MTAKPFSRADLIASLSAFAPKLMLDRARTLMTDRERLTYADAGALICGAMLPQAPGVSVLADGLFVQGLYITPPQGPETWLSPDEARTHPLCERWFAETMGEAVGEFIKIAATQANLGPGGLLYPTLATVEIFEAHQAASVVGASIHARFDGVDAATTVKVRLDFGTDIENAGLTVSYCVSGDVIEALARSARSLDAQGGVEAIAEAMIGEALSANPEPPPEGAGPTTVH